MNVAALREALAGLPDHLDVLTTSPIGEATSVDQVEIVNGPNGRFLSLSRWGDF